MTAAPPTAPHAAPQSAPQSDQETAPPTDAQPTPAPTRHALAGRIALVTGAGRGLGAEIARTLAEDGARLVIVDLQAHTAEACAARLRDSGHEARAYGCDVGDAGQVSDLMVQVCEAYGGVDIIVNNAAIDMTAPIAEIQPEHWDRILRTNLTAPFLVTRCAVDAMLTRSAGAAPGVRGHVVNIASTASKRAWPNAAAYHATKWGLLGLSHALHAELRPQGIKVSAIVAGGMRTPFLLDRFPDLDPGLLQDPANVAAAVRWVLLQPDETVVPELTVLPMRETSWP